MVTTSSAATGAVEARRARIFLTLVSLVIVAAKARRLTRAHAALLTSMLLLLFFGFLLNELIKLRQYPAEDTTFSAVLGAALLSVSGA